MKLTKTLFLAPLVASSLIGGAFAAADNQDDLSYAVGYTMGQALKTQMDQNNITTDNQEVVSGLTDGISGSKSKLTPDQMQNAMLQFQQQAVAAQKK